MTGKVEISALHVHRYAGGRFEFTAFAAGDNVRATVMRNGVRPVAGYSQLAGAT
jgi:hypothetical protein